MSVYGRSRTLRVPITVTLSTATMSRNITRHVGDVKFRHTIPGGFATLSCALNRAFADYSEELAQYARLRFTDGRNGSVLSEGRLEDPGRTASAQGQVWSLSGYGAQAHAKDWTGAYVAVDSSMASWVPAPRNQPWVSSSAQQVTDEWWRAHDRDGSGNLITSNDQDPPIIWFDGLMVTPSTGTLIAPATTVASYMYPILAESGQALASIVGSYINGNMAAPGSPYSGAQNNTTLYVGLDREFTTGIIRPTPGSDVHPFSTGQFPANFSWRRAVDWNTNALDAVPAVTWEFLTNPANPSGTPPPAGSLTVGDATWWAFTATVRAIMHDQYGTSIPASSPFDVTSCSTDEVFADLVGTRLPLWDPNTTVITPGTDGLLNQFAFPDPVTTDQLLAELMAAEGDLMFWAAWESYQRTIASVTAWRARAEWSLWPSIVKHIIGMDDGCDLPTSTQELFDGVTVRWRDATGATRSTFVGTSNALLTAAGIHRRGTVDAADNVVADVAGAITYGTRWLADNAAPRGTGTLTVAHEVMDRQTGRMLAPWELRPGCLVQIRGADPSAYSQGATARNGRNVFRVIAVEFDSSSGAATLELDSPPNSIWDQIGAANRDLVTRRRR